MPRRRGKLPDLASFDFESNQSPLERAQELVYDAYEAPSDRRRRALAREAQ